MTTLHVRCALIREEQHCWQVDQQNQNVEQASHTYSYP